MEQIKVKRGVTTDGDWEEFDLEDLGCKSKDEWCELSLFEKENRLQEALDSLPERVGKNDRY